MNPTPISSPTLLLDGQPFMTPEFSTWKSFEDICTFYSDHLHAHGRAILAIRMDGIEVDCVTPPTYGNLQFARKIDVESCLFEDLIKVTLDYQIKTTQSLVATITELSTDCLIQTPQDTFTKWKEFLETLKSLVGFVPKLFSFQPFMHPSPSEIDEENLTMHIQQIQERVDTCRKAWDVQDVVLFSDTLELGVIPWLKKHISINQKVYGNISIKSVAS